MTRRKQAVALRVFYEKKKKNSACPKILHLMFV